MFCHQQRGKETYHSGFLDEIEIDFAQRSWRGSIAGSHDNMVEIVGSIRRRRGKKRFDVGLERLLLLQVAGKAKYMTFCVGAVISQMRYSSVDSVDV